MGKLFVVKGAINFEIGWLCDGNQCSRDDGFCPGHLSGGKTLLIDEVVAAHDEADAKAQAFQQAKTKIASSNGDHIEWIEWDELEITDLPEDQYMRLIGQPTL